MIQPAKVLINLHRKAVPDDPYYGLAQGLPMGALSTGQLAQVIALEIEKQIIEKSMRGPRCCRRTIIFVNRRGFSPALIPFSLHASILMHLF